MKQIEKKTNVKAISLDGVDTAATWRVESKEPIMEATLDWLEDDTQDMETRDDEEFGSVPTPEPLVSQPEGTRDLPNGSTNNGKVLDVGLPHHSSSSSRVYQFPGIFGGHHSP